VQLRAREDLGVDVTVEQDAEILPGTQLHGRTHVGEGARVGPGCTLTDTRVGAGASVVNSVCAESEIGPEAPVGPFAYLRPGTRLARKSKVGAYGETKNADLGEGAKVPHLTYVGDAEIGEGSNIGAGSVFVNYDGVDKHRSVIGSHVRVGSDNMIVAPVEVGDGAYTAAGSVIVQDVPPGAMAVARARQRNVEGWVERRRAGTPSAEAARRAQEKEAPWAVECSPADRRGCGGQRRLPRTAGHPRAGALWCAGSGDDKPRAASSIGGELSEVSGIKASGQKKLMLFTGRAHPDLAKEVADNLHVELTPTSAYDFANGETFVRFLE